MYEDPQRDRLSVEQFLHFRDDFIQRSLKRNKEFQQMEAERKFLAILLLSTYAGFILSLLSLLITGALSCWILLFTFLIAIHLDYLAAPKKFNNIDFVYDTEIDFYSRIIKNGFRSEEEGEVVLHNLACLVFNSEIPQLERRVDAPSVEDLSEWFDLEN